MKSVFTLTSAVSGGLSGSATSLLPFIVEPDTAPSTPSTKFDGN